MDRKDLEAYLKNQIKKYPDFPKPGILFYDIFSVMASPQHHQALMRHLIDRYREMEIDAILALELRGFLFAPTVCFELGIPLIAARKPKKLPGKVIEIPYGLEYGEDKIQVQKHMILPGMKVVIFDDLLATGGTAAASVEAVRELGGEVVELMCAIELPELNGRNKLPGIPIYTVVRY